MNVPLYAPAGEAWSKRSEQRAANLGLVFDKYFAGWTAKLDDYASEKVKHDWVARIAKASKRASPDGLQEAAGRQGKLVAALGGEIWQVKAMSRFVTGTGIANPLENGFAFHHALGVPCLPATGLKGALRAYWEQWHKPGLPAERQGEERQRIDRLLGKSGAGSVLFFDMLPTAPPELVPEVMTPHYGKWYAASGSEIAGNAPGDWMSPTPIPFLAVEAGAVFQIAVAPRKMGDPAWKEDLPCIASLLKETLTITGLGAKTAVGYGRFELCGSGRAPEEARAAEQAAAPPAAKGAAAAAKRRGPAFAAGETLRAGTRLSWHEVGNVELTRPVLLQPGIALPVRFVDDGSEDEAPIEQISQLRHIG